MPIVPIDATASSGGHSQHRLGQKPGEGLPWMMEQMGLVECLREIKKEGLDAKPRLGCVLCRAAADMKIAKSGVPSPSSLHHW